MLSFNTSLRMSIAAAMAFILAGCPSSHVLVGEARPAISPSEVKIYLRPPAKYEEVALLEASSKQSWAVTDQGRMNKAVARLKEEAAKLGANGVLLQGAGDQYGGSVNTANATGTSSGGSTYATGTGVATPIMHKSASGIAIYVIEE